MEDVDKLIERINEVEKALESQPLPCIPLPTGLEQFTWVALGHTITELHKYISENNMVTYIYQLTPIYGFSIFRAIFVLSI